MKTEKQTDKKTTQKTQASGSGKKLQLKLVKSVICTPQWMRAIVRSLALKRMNDVVVVNDNPAIRGAVKRVPHLVELKEL